MEIKSNNMEIKSNDLVRLLNAAIYYGGDRGGPYYNDRDRVELMELAESLGIKLKFERKDYGDIISVEDLE